MIHVIDSHAHLTGETLFPQFPELVDRAAQAGVQRIVNICTDRDSLARAFEVMEQYPSVVHAAAIPPHDVEEEGAPGFPAVVDAAKKGLLVAIGETGLDYYREEYSKALQKEFFIKHLQLANEVDLPLVIHCRDAFADFFDILDGECRHEGQWRAGVLHCFTGNMEDAEQLVKRGWYVSFSGIITFNKSEVLREIAREIPLENILIETDSPWLAPHPYRGKTNEPSYVIETAKTIAQVKGISFEEVAQTTFKNTQHLFRL